MDSALLPHKVIELTGAYAPGEKNGAPDPNETVMLAEGTKVTAGDQHFDLAKRLSALLRGLGKEDAVAGVLGGADRLDEGRKKAIEKLIVDQLKAHTSIATLLRRAPWFIEHAVPGVLKRAASPTSRWNDRPLLIELGDIGPLLLGESHGSGGFAEVMEGVGRRLPYDVVVKLFHHNPKPGKDGADPVEEELKLLQRMRGTVAPRGLTYGTLASGERYIVMEHVRGWSLRKIVQATNGHPLPPEALNDLGHMLWVNMARMHDFGIVHRDLKPDNIMLDTEGELKILDFGLQMSLDDGAAERDTISGTVSYMAPEQARAGRLNQAVDIHACARMVLEWATGEYEKDETGNPLELLRRAEARPDTSAVKDEQLKGFLDMCFDEPERRPTHSAGLAFWDKRSSPRMRKMAHGALAGKHRPIRLPVMPSVDHADAATLLQAGKPVPPAAAVWRMLERYAEELKRADRRSNVRNALYVCLALLAMGGSAAGIHSAVTRPGAKPSDGGADVQKSGTPEKKEAPVKKNVLTLTPGNNNTYGMTFFPDEPETIPRDGVLGRAHLPAQDGYHFWLEGTNGTRENRGSVRLLQRRQVANLKGIMDLEDLTSVDMNGRLLTEMHMELEGVPTFVILIPGQATLLVQNGKKILFASAGAKDGLIARHCDEVFDEADAYSHPVFIKFVEEYAKAMPALKMERGDLQRWAAVPFKTWQPEKIQIPFSGYIPRWQSLIAERADRKKP